MVLQAGHSVQGKYGALDMVLRAGNSVQGKYGALDMVLRAGNSVQREIWDTLRQIIIDKRSIRIRQFSPLLMLYLT
jgi:hypothetical protein